MQAFSMKQLREAATCLPTSSDLPGSDMYRVAIAPEWGRLSYMEMYQPLDSKFDVAYIEFRRRKTSIYGCKVDAWFYGDMLIKVCV